MNSYGNLKRDPQLGQEGILQGWDWGWPLEGGQGVARKMGRYSRKKGQDVFQGKEEKVHIKDWGVAWGMGLRFPCTRNLTDGPKPFANSWS